MKSIKNHRPPILSCIFPLLSIFFFSFYPAFADTEGLQELKIEADQMVCEQEHGICRASGHVVVTSHTPQKQRTLKANEITVTFTKGSKIKSIEAQGQVHFIGDGLEATASRADFHYDDNVLYAQGNVTVKEKDNVIKGDRGKINLTTKSYELTQSKTNRVQGTIRLK